MAFRAPWATSKYYVPVKSIAMLAHDTRWPHEAYTFAQFVGRGLVGDIAQLESVGWLYRHENVNFIKRIKRERGKNGVNKEGVTADIYVATRTRIRPGAGVGPYSRDGLSSKTIARASRLPPRAWKEVRHEATTCGGHRRTVGIFLGRLGWLYCIIGAGKRVGS